MTDNVKLSAPWVVYYRKLEALFGEDPDIKLVFDEDDVSIKMYVENAAKADALTQLLPTTVPFGNVILKITVIPANATPTKMGLLRDAFNGNPAFSYAVSTDVLQSNPIHYFVFKNKVVQFYNDDLGDVNGNCSTLYHDLAKELLGETQGVHFCTDLP